MSISNVKDARSDLNGDIFHFIKSLYLMQTAKVKVLDSLKILSLRFSQVPYSLYGTCENFKIKIISKTGTRSEMLRSVASDMMFIKGSKLI